MQNITKTVWGALAALSLLAAGQASAQVAKWRGLLGNQKLVQTTSVGPARINIPGAAVEGGGVKTTTELHLCKDGSFLRVETSSVGASGVKIPSANVGSSGINDVSKVSGKWKIVSTDSVHASIQLTPTKADDLTGDDRKLEVSFDGAYTLVNDERWNRMKSPVCQ